MTTPIISLRSVSRGYSGQSGPLALESIDLDIYDGEFVAIVGSSGAGKSTLLNILGLLDSPDAGSYRLVGEGTEGLAERERDSLRSHLFGFVFQDSFVIPRESVARNIALPLRLRGEQHSAQVDAVTTALAQFGLLHLSSQNADTLSGGERQRVALARAVAGAPRVVLADEPTGNLDTRNTAVVMRLLSELNASGVTVVVITHSPEVAALTKRQIRIEDGLLVEDTSTEATSVSLTRSEMTETRSRQRPYRRSAWHLCDAVSALMLSPARSIGIVAAFVLAIAGLVTSVNMSATAAQQISGQLDAAALDRVVARMPVTTTTAEVQFGSRAVASVPNVLAASPRVKIAATTGQPGRWIQGAEVTTDAPVLAVDGSFLEVENIAVEPSSAAGWLDVADGSPVAILGEGVAEDLGFATSRTGETIRLAEQDVVVAGYIRSAPRDPALSESILVSLTDFAVPTQSEYEVVARTKSGYPAAVAEVVPFAVDASHPERVVVQTVADLRVLTRGVTSDLAANILLISATLLVLVCFTSATSMFLTVASRTREIALRRAVGATRRDIRSLFLVEGTVIGLAGGLSGLALGTWATTILSAAQNWSPTFDATSALLGLISGVVAGGLSAVVPAFRAARIEPALALKSA